MTRTACPRIESVNIVLAELYRVERVATKFDALASDPDLDTKFVLAKLQEASHKVATFTASVTFFAKR